jgi:ketosteroid isomerase-like protein
VSQDDDRRGLVGPPQRDQHGAMAFDVEQLLRLWTDALPADDAAAAVSFRELYTDPVSVNGVPLGAADLVARARVMQAALEEPEREVVSVVDAGDSVAVAFRLAGRQVGPLDTPAGRLSPTGQRVEVRIIDVLTLTEGRISAIWMVADWLSTLAAVGAVELRTAADPAGAA